MWLTLTLAFVMSYPFFSVRVDSECVSVFVYSSRETLNLKVSFGASTPNKKCNIRRGINLVQDRLR